MDGETASVSTVDRAGAKGLPEEKVQLVSDDSDNNSSSSADHSAQFNYGMYVVNDGYAATHAPDVERAADSDQVLPSTVLELSRTDSATSSTSIAPSAAWTNQHIQTILDLPPDSQMRCDQLANTLLNFAQQAQAYATVVCRERLLPLDQKTIKPSMFGGIAGGQKFVVHGVLFKQSQDTFTGAAGQSRVSYLYGHDRPRPDLAAKASGHDLNGAIRMGHVCEQLSLGAPGSSSSVAKLSVRVPIQCVIDFRGQRYTAMPVLPLGSRTLVYGSCDGGQTVFNSNDAVNEFMADAAKELHLAEHVVSGKKLHLAGDVEVHHGRDGRFYALDLARVFPPESYLDCPHLPRVGRCFLYRLLRPEFLVWLRVSGHPPLSADAFSRWGQDHATHHNDTVRRATKLLLREVIPEYARALSKAQDKGFHEPITARVHKRGINLRHIGLLRSLVDAQAVDVRNTLFVEICARSLKALLRGRWRHLSETSSSDTAFSLCTADFFRLMLSAKPGATRFWNQEVVACVDERFGACALLPPERRDLFAAVDRDGLLLRILRHVTGMTGVVLSQEVLEDLAETERTGVPGAVRGFHFTVADVVEIRATQRFMNILDLSRARWLEHLADTGGEDGQDAEDGTGDNRSTPQVAVTNHSLQGQSEYRLLRRARAHYLAAVHTDCLNASAICGVGVTEARAQQFRGDFQGSDAALLTAFRDLVQLSTSASTLPKVPAMDVLQGVRSTQDTAIHVLEVLLSLWLQRLQGTSGIGGANRSMAEVSLLPFAGGSSARVYEQVLHWVTDLSAVLPAAAASARQRVSDMWQRLDQCREQRAQVHSLVRRLSDAAWDGGVERVRSLCEAKAECDIFVDHSREVPLHKAAWQGHVQVVRALCELGARVNIADAQGETPLHKAAWQGHAQVLKELCGAKADVNARTHSGETALHKAAWQGHVLIVAVLCAQASVQVNALANDGETALHKAAWRGDTAMVETLCRVGCDPNVQDRKGETALMKAAWQGHVAAVELLCGASADVALASTGGLTAIRAAELQKHDAVLLLLKELNA